MLYIISIVLIIYVFYWYFSTKSTKGFDKVTYQKNYDQWRNQYPQNVKFKKEFNINIVGETFEGRQQVIKYCKAGDRCYLVHEKDNQYDLNAVAVMHQSGNKIGYIEKEKNYLYVYDIEHGIMIDSTILRISGELPYLGVVLNIKLWE